MKCPFVHSKANLDQIPCKMMGLAFQVPRIPTFSVSVPSAQTFKLFALEGPNRSSTCITRLELAGVHQNWHMKSEGFINMTDLARSI
jgi:hypothetical protein